MGWRRTHQPAFRIPTRDAGARGSRLIQGDDLARHKERITALFGASICVIISARVTTAHRLNYCRPTSQPRGSGRELLAAKSSPLKE